MTEIEYRYGDATQPVGKGPKLLVHICNNVGAWGAGFTGAISKRWLDPEETFRRREGKTSPMWKLGETQRVQVTDDIAVINMVCQDGLIGPDNPRPIRYDSVEAAIDKVRVMAQSEEASVHMPRIGCGLAGGRWELIEAIIVRKLTNNDIPVTVYDYRP